jgi:hypothetical protein
VSSVDAYCLDFIGQHLNTSNCIRYLRKAVKHNISDIQQQCVALAAQGTHSRSNATCLVQSSVQSCMPTCCNKAWQPHIAALAVRLLANLLHYAMQLKKQRSH